MIKLSDALMNKFIPGIPGYITADQFTVHTNTAAVNFKFFNLVGSDPLKNFGK